MKPRHLFFFLLASLIFSGCSYQHYFIIGNSSNETITIKYSLDTTVGSNVIFDRKGEVYQSTSDYFPDWEHKLVFKDLDNSDNAIWIELAPKNTLVFGTLSNDRYDKNTMKSASGKVFNLNEMTFTVNGVDYTINKDNFHDFFLEDGGTHKYVIH